MSYCGTLDVTILGQMAYTQLDFASHAEFLGWIAGTLIPRASRFVDNVVGHDFTHHSGGTLVVDGSGKEILWATKAGLVNGAPARLLPVPFISVTSVTIDSTVVAPITDIKVYERYLAYEDNKFDAGRQNVTIVCDWGYTSVPDEIAYVTSQLCVNVLNWMIRNEMMPDDIAPYLEEGGNVGVFFRNPKIMTRNEKDLLKRYITLQVGLGGIS